MTSRLPERVRGTLRLLHLSAKQLAGRRYWIAPLLPAIWIGFQLFRLAVRWREETYVPADALTVLIGFPLTVLAIGLGVRVIAGEIDRRTLEIAYTVPGGTRRVWLAKLGAALLILVVAEVLLAVLTWAFCTDVPLGALYGALQAAVFYLVLSMALSALFKSEATGALLCVGVLVLNNLVQGGNLRVSPFWNPEKLVESDPADVLAWTVQNRIGFILAIAAVTALAFARSEKREKLLGG